LLLGTSDKLKFVGHFPRGREMTTIKWIILTLLLSSFLAGPVWVPKLDQEPSGQTQTQQNSVGGDPMCCVGGFSCCEGRN
jgi:hypothetical protein